LKHKIPSKLAEAAICRTSLDLCLVYMGLSVCLRYYSILNLNYWLWFLCTRDISQPTNRKHLIFACMENIIHC